MFIILLVWIVVGMPVVILLTLKTAFSGRSFAWVPFLMILFVSPGVVLLIKADPSLNQLKILAGAAFGSSVLGSVLAEQSNIVYAWLRK